MNGHASFDEVFLGDARVPAANVIGDVGALQVVSATAGRTDLVAGHAATTTNNTATTGDPLVRKEVARVTALARVAPWTAQRAAAGRAKGTERHP